MNFVYLEHRGAPEVPDCCQRPSVSFKGEAMLEVGKGRWCGEVEVSAGCRDGSVNSLLKQHAVLQLVFELAGVV